MLQAQCDDAMLLDSSVRKLYAAEHAPSKNPYRPKKKADAYQLEIQRLAEAQANNASPVTTAPPTTTDTPMELDFLALEREAADFMRNRNRK
ncbi:hypothetical protein NPS53_08730 [Pseudomonas putida]|uniref:hypothetical protein n=1 Tax=Pseudomonas putida TaxID=303 RepID=UPI00236345F1|nr:hypothetical protein [Pseudomonas putida]MDD2139658.1 hypothetical protein [Pseudomonas putida]HDS1721582.1 hypothetical protein [Pseudomonas putida]